MSYLIRNFRYLAGQPRKAGINLHRISLGSE
jgi:hypothetical protein